LIYACQLAQRTAACCSLLWGGEARRYFSSNLTLIIKKSYRHL
jgi:hypothetical protein